jgi:hypothetical protein
MTPEEHRALVDLVGRLLAENRLDDVHATGLAATRGADFSWQYCARYLRAIAAELHVRSAVTYAKTLERARRHIETESGEPIADIVVRLGGGETEIVGRSEVSLSETADLESLVKTLADVAVQIEEEDGRAT